MMRKSLFIIMILIFVFSFAAASFAQNSTAAHIKFYYRFLNVPGLKADDSRSIKRDDFQFEMYPKFSYQKGDNTLFWEMQINATAGKLFGMNVDGNTPTATAPNLWQVKWFVYPKMFNQMLGVELGRDDSLSKGLDNFGISTYHSPSIYPFVKMGDMEIGIIFTLINWNNVNAANAAPGNRAMSFAANFSGIFGPINLKIRIPIITWFSNNVNTKDNFNIRFMFQAKVGVDLGIMSIDALLGVGYRSSSTDTAGTVAKVSGFGVGIDLLAQLKMIPGITPFLRISFLTSGDNVKDAEKDPTPGFVFGGESDNGYMWDWYNTITVSGDQGDGSWRDILANYTKNYGFLKIMLGAEFSMIPDLLLKIYVDMALLPFGTEKMKNGFVWAGAGSGVNPVNNDMLLGINFGLFVKYSGFGNGCWIEVNADFTYITSQDWVDSMGFAWRGGVTKKGIGMLLKFAMMNDF